VPIPVPTRMLWAVLSRVGGTPVLQLPPEEIRAASDQRRRLISMPGASVVVGRAHPDTVISDKTAILPDGVGLPVRVYRPMGTIGQALPLVLNFHGGGFVSGDPRQSEWWCSTLAHDASAVVVSVDYRLAPEHPYPSAPEDCYAATVWAVEHAADLGADGGRLAVMGDSAGGNLAAVVSLMARDRGGPAIGVQILLYPAVDFVNSYPSEDENEFAPILGKADLRVSRIYCPGREHEPYASPLFADHTGLPPALIQTAEHDPLRDQGPAYAEALQRAGVEVRLTNYVDAVHGYISIPGVVPAARQALAEAVSILSDKLDYPLDDDTAAAG
jgi:acetyl esterase